MLDAVSSSEDEDDKVMNEEFQTKFALLSEDKKLESLAEKA